MYRNAAEPIRRLLVYDGLTFAYQWERCAQDTANCDAIAGATAQIYTVTRADEGFELRVLVTASNGAGSPPAEPAPEGTPPVEPPQLVAPANTTRPSVTGTAQVGATLTADRGSGPGPSRSRTPTSGGAATWPARAASTSAARPVRPTR